MMPAFSCPTEQLTEGFDNRASSQELRRRTKRAGFGERQKKNRNELNPRRYSKELARIQKLQNRRAKSKMLLSGRVTGKSSFPLVRTGT